MAKIMTMMSKQLLGYCICLRVKFPKTHGLRIGYCSCLEWYKNSKRVKMGSYCWQKAGVQVKYAGSESLHHLCGIRNGGHTGYFSGKTYVYLGESVLFSSLWYVLGLFLFSCLAQLYPMV